MSSHSEDGPRAILSVADKRGVTELAAALHELGWRLFGTRGTARHLRDAGVPVEATEALTGAPDLLGGRLKTLHANVFGGLLYRRGVPDDELDVRRHALTAVDLVACTFHSLPADADTSHDLEWIDVGGPAMVRAAAKNHRSVLPLVDGADFAGVIEGLRSRGGRPEGVSAEERLRLAVKAFRRTAEYDVAIADRLAR